VSLAVLVGALISCRYYYFEQINDNDDDDDDDEDDDDAYSNEFIRKKLETLVIWSPTFISTP